MGFQARIAAKVLSSGLKELVGHVDRLAVAEDPREQPGARDPEAKGLISGRAYRQRDLERQTQVEDARRGARLQRLTQAERESIERVLPQLELNLLAGRDPIQAAYRQRIGQRPLSAAEKQVARALIGKHADPIETASWTGPLAPEEVASLPRARKPITLEDWIPLLMAGPTAAVWAAYWWANLSGDPFTMSLFAAVSVSANAGEYLTGFSKPFGGDWGGVNALEESDVKHELVRIYDRLALPEGSPADGVDIDPRTATERIATEAAIIDALLDLRAEALEKNHRDETEEERNIVARLRAFAAEAHTALPGDVQVLDEATLATLQATRENLVASLDRSALAKMSAGIAPRPIVDPNTWREGMNALIGALIAQVGATTNAAFVDMARYLEAKHASPEKPLEKSEIDALRRCASASPNLPELLAASRLLASKALAVTDLWPEAKPLELSQTAGTMDLQKIAEDVAAYNREVHSVQEQGQRVGRLLPAIGWLLGLGGLIGTHALAPDIGFLPWAVASYGPPLLGHISAGFLRSQSDKALLFGESDGASGGHVGSLFERAIDRLADASRLFAIQDPAELRVALGEEAQTLSVFLAASPGGPGDAALRKFQEQLASLEEMLGNAAAPHVLDEVRGKLRSAWVELMSPEAWRGVRAGILARCWSPDFSPDWIHVAKKRNLLVQLDRALAAASETGGQVYNMPLVAAARDVRNARNVRLRAAEGKMDKILKFIPVVSTFAGPLMRAGRAKEDRGLADAIADHISRHPSANFDPRVILTTPEAKRVYRDQDPNPVRVRHALAGLIEDVNAELAKLPMVNDEQLTAIPQGLLDTTYDRALSLFYGTSLRDLKAPKAHFEDFQPVPDQPGVGTLVCRIGGDDPSPGDGHLALKVNISQGGEVDLAALTPATLDLGTAALSDLAKAAVGRFNGASEADLKRAKASLADGDGEANAPRRFTVRLASKAAYEVTMEPDGLARFGSIRALAQA
jgi:hypothetical protein